MILVHEIEEILWTQTMGPKAGSNNWQFIVHIKGNTMNNISVQVPDQDVQTWVNGVLGRSLNHEDGVRNELNDLIENSQALDERFKSELTKNLYGNSAIPAKES